MARKRIYDQPLTGAEKQRRHREKRKEEGLKKRSMTAVIAEDIEAEAQKADRNGYVKIASHTLLNWAKAITK